MGSPLVRRVNPDCAHVQSVAQCVAANLTAGAPANVCTMAGCCGDGGATDDGASGGGGGGGGGDDAMAAWLDDTEPALGAAASAGDGFR